MGRFDLLEENDLEVGQWVTLTFHLVVGEEGLAEHGCLRIGIPRDSWSRPLVMLPRYWPEVTGETREYAPFEQVNTTVRVQTKSNARPFLGSFRAMIPSDANKRGEFSDKTNWRYWIDVRIEGGSLECGDEIFVVYGDRQFGERGARVQCVPKKDVGFTAYVDARGDGNFIEHPDSPVCRNVCPGEASRARVVVPSIVRPGERCPVSVSVTDSHGNRPSDTFVGSLPLSVCTPAWESTVRIDEKSPYSTAEGLLLGQDETAYVVKPTGVLPAVRSNPILCDSTKCRIVWGDLHVHSMHYDYDERRGLSMRDHGPGACYDYAKEISFLDFVAIADNPPGRKGWEESLSCAEDHYRPGAFVTFPSFEYSDPAAGHRNVLYAAVNSEQLWRNGEHYDLPGVQRYYRGRKDVLMIPHHSKAFSDWRTHDPELEPLVEVYSSWGSSEAAGSDLWGKLSLPGGSVHEALLRGCRFGMVGGSDIEPFPGRCCPGTTMGLAPFSGGLTAVFAEELTRETVFEALRSRRCYATTGARVILMFSVCGAAMGQFASPASPSEPKRMEVMIIGTDVITRVDVIKNDKVFVSAHPDREHLACEFEDHGLSQAGDFYYLRVYQADGNRAWSSPVWVDIAQNIA